MVYVSLFENSSSFEGGRPLQSRSGAASGPVVVVEFNDLDPGRYAIKAYQDLNSDGNLEQSGIGIPLEPAGVSNDAQPAFGPPRFEACAFEVREGQRTRAEVTLVLRDSTATVGVGTVIRSLPYGSGDVAAVPIPLISYRGDNWVVEGPQVRRSIGSWSGISVDALARFRFDGYEEDDDDVLTGMSDRDGTVEVGIRAIFPIVVGTELQVLAAADVLGNHNGQTVELTVQRPFSGERWSFTPRVRAEWLSDNVADYYYGVRFDEAISGRPRTNVDSTWIPSVGATALFDVGKNWTLLLVLNASYLSSEITSSPIVDERWVFSSIVGFGFTF